MALNAYDGLAEWFEYLNDDCGYEQWSQYLITILKGYSLKTGLDIGCGSGYFTRALEKEGYLMTGVDISIPMLNKAENLSKKQGLKSEYILGDITHLTVRDRVDFAVAINDCINYIPKNKLLTSFKKVHSSLKKDGVFFFDISSEKKYREKVPGVCVDDREKITYLSFNRVEEEKVTMDVSLFIRQGNGNYMRKDEQHTQYIYKQQEIENALSLAGFSLIKVSGHLGEEKEISDRLEFLAIRL